MTVEAVWHGQVIARSDDTVVVEGNHYFPPEDVDRALMVESETTTVCPWKGTAHYYTLESGERQSKNAVWYYPETKPKADHVRGRIAFWKDVEVREV
jgi:uncharacterized protein (DUF427 family)